MLRGFISFQKVEPTSRSQDKLGSFGDMKTRVPWTRGKNPELYQVWTSCSCSKPPSCDLSKLMFFDFFLMVIMVNHHLSPPPFGINMFYFIPSILLCKSKQKTKLNQLEFQVWVSEGFWLFDLFPPLFVHQKKQSTTLSSRDTDFWCQGYNVGCNKLGNWPFPTYDTHFEGGIWPLGLLGPGMRCTPSCKGPLRTWESFIYVTWAYENKMSFGRKRGKCSEYLTTVHNGETFWTKNHWCFAPKVSCDEPLDLSLRYEGCKIYDMAHGQNKTMSFLHLVLIAALECLPESSEDA